MLQHHLRIRSRPHFDPLMAPTFTNLMDELRDDKSEYSIGGISNELAQDGLPDVRRLGGVGDEIAIARCGSQFSSVNSVNHTCPKKPKRIHCDESLCLCFVQNSKTSLTVIRNYFLAFLATGKYTKSCV